uniref:Uncharacterized protein n=1 Tax=Solanum tuberosum TaxID=4113 RepID=M1E0V2_SOLTU
MVARTEKANMEAAPVGMEAARPSSVATRDLPLLLRWWCGVAPVGDGWGWAPMGVGSETSLRSLIGVNSDFSQFRKVNFTLGLEEEEKGEERSRFIDFVKVSLWISSGVIPKRYVRSHSIGVVHPRANHDLIQRI